MYKILLAIALTIGLSSVSFAHGPGGHGYHPGYSGHPGYNYGYRHYSYPGFGIQIGPSYPGYYQNYPYNAYPYGYPVYPQYPAYPQYQYPRPGFNFYIR